MDALFIVLLLVFFAQGRIGGWHPLVRGLAMLLLGAFAAALFAVLQ